MNKPQPKISLCPRCHTMTKKIDGNCAKCGNSEIEGISSHLDEQNYEKEEWGGWKIVSDMLDNPDEHEIYPTGECYKKLYDFVIAQKAKAEKKGWNEAIDEATKILTAPSSYYDHFDFVSGMKDKFEHSKK